MEQIFSAINNVFRFVTPVSDFFWDFPTNFDWYASIPILGNFSLAIILLVGSGIYFTIRLGFIQVTYFAKGVRLLVRERKKTTTGISSLTAFFLSSAMRVGPGNILGVTGAISTMPSILSRYRVNVHSKACQKCSNTSGCASCSK